MKRLIPIALLAATAYGHSPFDCSVMKSTPFYGGSERVYTGRIEDRVNLWPIAYYREPALSVLWPIFSLTDDHLAIRPIYSQYRQDGKDSDYDEFNFLWPICQFDTKHDEHRIFPLFWGDGNFDLFPLLWWRFDKSFTLFPLVWWKKNDYFHVLPLWWQDERNFVSLLWCRDGSGNTDTCVVPPLLSWMKRTECGDKMLRFLLGLGGVNVERNGDVDSSWVFPLYYNDGRRFLSLPFGHERDGFTYLTPFVGVTHGEHRKGGWLWPLFGWTGDDRMDEAEAMINASTLDPKVKLEKRESEWGGRKHQWHEVEGVKVHVYDSSWQLSGLSTSDRSISWSAAGDGSTVTGEETSGFGNVFAYKSEHRRAVTFDAKTREKIRVDESGESGLFCKLLWHSEYEHEKGRHYDKKSILWRAWHYENDNGNVSVDAVPFFTYDSKTNGYSKTSLCWRLYRNEYDPKTDRRSVDFLFVPIWR